MLKNKQIFANYELKKEAKERKKKREKIILYSNLILK